MSLGEAIVVFLGGMGLFLTAVSGLGSRMLHLGGRRLRLAIAAEARHPAVLAAIATGIGALVQSGRGISAILGGLMTAGILEAGSVMPMLLWADLGTTALVFVASIDLRLLGLGIAGVAGTWLYFDRSGPELRRMLLEAAMSLALLFLGIGLMHLAGDSFSGSEGVHDRLMDVGMRALRQAGSSDVLAFAAGVGGAMLVQSSSGMAILAMAAAQGGLLAEDPAVMIVLGATLGNGAVSLVLAPRARGLARQIAVHQGVTKAAAAGVLVLLAVLEQSRGWFLLEHAIDALSAEPSRRLALLYLVCNALPLVAHYAGRRFLATIVPPAAEDDLARPRFISNEATDDPDIALLLAAREQQRLVERLVRHLPVDAPARPGADVPPEQLAGLAGRLCAEIGHVLGLLAAGALTAAQVTQLTNLQSRNEAIRALHETLDVLRTTLAEARRRPAAAGLAAALAEGLGALLLCADDAAKSEAAEDVDLLLAMSADRGGLVDGMRRRMMATAGADGATQEVVYAMTSLFERAVWLVQRYAALLRG